MAKNTFRGIVTSFRRSKRAQHTNETIVEVGEGADPATLVGAKALWTGEGGLRIVGRVVARHGNGRAVRVRWRKGFPPQGIGTPAEIVVK
jgi:ribosomal protein L35AE/L33A